MPFGSSALKAADSKAKSQQKGTQYTTTLQPKNVNICYNYFIIEQHLLVLVTVSFNVQSFLF